MTFTKDQIEQALAELPKENRPVITAIVGQLEARVKDLEARVSDMGWQLNPDRMGQ